MAESISGYCAEGRAFGAICEGYLIDMCSMRRGAIAASHCNDFACSTLKVSRGLLTAILMLFSPTLFSVQLEIQPRIEVVETYSDNIFLASPGNEEEEYVTEINPGILVSGSGRRTRFDLDYRMQNVFYTKESGRNERFHQLSGMVAADLIEDHFFIDLTGGMTQRLIDPEVNIPQGNITLTNNRTDVLTSGISPYLRYPLGRRVKSELRYTYDQVDYDNEEISDSNSRKVVAEFENVSSSGPLSWLFLYENEKVDFDSVPDADFESAEIDVRYKFLRYFGVLATVGYEENEYEVPVNQVEPEGNYWAFGVIVTPLRTMSLELGVNERFFGNGYFLDFDYITKQAEWNAKYEEDVVAMPQLQSGKERFAFGERAITAGIEEFSINNEVFVQKRFSLNLEQRVNKNIWSLSLFNERREFQLGLLEDRGYGGGGAWLRALSKSSRVEISAGWNRQEFSSGQVNEFWNGDASLIREFSKRIIGSVFIGHVAREEQGTISDYRENSVGARCVLQW